MYNKQLETFLIVAQEGSFSRAASRLYISPSAVIQQINNLEHDLQTALFKRTKHGTTLTPAGEYLQKEAALYIQKGDDIRSHLRFIESREHTICVGTSLYAKVRYLYDLWVLFTEAQNHYDIKMVNIEDANPQNTEAELIESIYNYSVWQRYWEFFKICDMPMACAVSRRHEIAAKPLLQYEDLRDFTLIIQSHSRSDSHQKLYNDIYSHQIAVREADEYDINLVWECSCKNSILVVPLCDQDILYDLAVIPCEWPHTLPYGIFYRDRLSGPAQKFLDFISEYSSLPMPVNFRR